MEGVRGRKLFACEPSEAPPPVRIVEAETRRKMFSSFIEEKIGRAQKENCGEHFSAGHARGASDGGANSFVHFPLEKGSRKC